VWRVKKFVVGVAVLLVLLVGALAVVPPFVDWSDHRATLADALSEAAGRPVRIEGDVGLRLLPTPALRIERLGVGGTPGTEGAGDLLTLARLDLRVALLPLLGGRIRAERMDLVAPVLNLTVLADGRPNWALPGGTGTGSGPAADAVRFDSVAVSDGTVIWRDLATGRTERIDGIAGDLSAGSLAGPFRVDVQARVRDVPLRADLTADRFTEAGALPLRGTVVVADRTATLRFDGIAAARGANRFQGSARLEGADLQAVARTLGALDVAALPARPFSVRGQATVAPDHVAFRDLAIQAGDGTGTGVVQIGAGPTVEATLSFGRLDVTPFVLLAGHLVRDGGGPGGTLSADVDLGIETAVHAGQTFRQVRLAGRVRDGTVTVDRLAALLPGGGSAVVAGTLGDVGGERQGSATVEVRSDNLRLLLRTFGVEPGGVAPDRLTRLSGSLRVDGRPGTWQVTDVDVTLDTMRLTGAAALATDRDRPGLGLRLSADSVNLDAYGLTGGAAGAGGGDPLALAERFDANVELDVRELTVGGRTFHDVVVDGSLAGGGVTLNELRLGGWAGLSGSIQGTVASLRPLGAFDLGFALSSEDPQQAARALGIALPGPVARLGRIGLGGKAAGTPDGLTLDLVVDALGGTAEVAGTLAPAAGEAALATRLRLPEAGDLLRLIDPGFQPGREPPGPLDLYLRVVGEPGRLGFEDLRGQIGPTALAGGISVRLAGTRPRIEADLQAGEIDADRFRAATARPPAPAAMATGRAPFPQDPLPLDWLRAFDGRLALTVGGLRWGDLRLADAAVAATLADGVLAVEPLDGSIWGGRIGLSGRIAASDGGRPPEATATLRLVDVAVALPDGPTAAPDRLLRVDDARADVDARLTGRGASVAALVSTLTGTAQVRLRDGRLVGVDLAAARDRLAGADDPREILGIVNQAMGRGGTPFGRLVGSFAVQDGVARTDDLALDGPAGAVRTAGSVDLGRWTANLTATVTLPGTGQPFAVILAGPLDAPVRTPDVSALQTDLAARLQQELMRRLATPPPPPPAVAPVPIEPAAPEPAPPSTAATQVPPDPPAGPEAPAAPGTTAPPPAAEPAPPPDVIRDILRGLIR
jgi:uncharacterized protein involved in outer membrane biogenesis